MIRPDRTRGDLARRLRAVRVRPGAPDWLGPLAAGLLALAALAAGIVLAAGSLAAGSDDLDGPVAATVVRVIDGDTMVVRARIWLGQEVETAVRIAGIDAPELNGDCASERSRAARARDLLTRLVGDGAVSLRTVRHGKFAGRVLARVESASGADLGRALLDAGLARPYGGRRESWCERAAR